MTRPLSDDELRDLLRGAYAPRTRTFGSPRGRPSAAWSVALLLIGAVAGATMRVSGVEPPIASSPPRDPMVAVQDAGSRYAEALAELASAPPARPDSAALAREVVATSLVGVTRSLLSAVDERPEAIGLYRLAAELRRATAPPGSIPEAGAAF